MRAVRHASNIPPVIISTVSHRDVRMVKKIISHIHHVVKDRLGAFRTKLDLLVVIGDTRY
jgi:hypothetical protein